MTSQYFGSNSISLAWRLIFSHAIKVLPLPPNKSNIASPDLLEFVIALSGSFDVILNDGSQQKTVTLNKPFEGLLITNEIWRELKNFSSGAVCLVLNSDVFLEEDYIRDFEDFITYLNM